MEAGKGGGNGGTSNNVNNKSKVKKKARTEHLEDIMAAAGEPQGGGSTFQESELGTLVQLHLYSGHSPSSVNPEDSGV